MRYLSQGASPHLTGKRLEAGAQGTPVLHPPGAGTWEALHICQKKMKSEDGEEKGLSPNRGRGRGQKALDAVTGEKHWVEKE